MLRVPVEQAKAGMVLAHSVPNPQKPEHTLLKAGYELLEEDIERLRSLRVWSLWVRYPSLDFLDELLDPEMTRQQQEMYGVLKGQFESTQDISFAKVDYSVYVRQVGQLFQRLLATQSRSAKFISELHGESDDIFLHGTTVAHLALLIGLRLQGYLVHERNRLPVHLATDLTPLGVGCLLHDLGKLKLPEDRRSFRLTAGDRGDGVWQSHTEAGFEMVQGGLDAGAGQVVINHHQHFDGSGFPARREQICGSGEVWTLRGHEIHIFCRIATVADRFDGFRRLPDGRLAPTVVALKRMANPGYVKWFDPEVYRAFQETVPPFAQGEQVTLNNGQDVVVVELNERDPCRPVVRPVDLARACVGHQAAGRDKEEPEQDNDINLASRLDLRIAKVGSFDVTPYLTAGQSEREHGKLAAVGRGRRG